ncbi:MAG: potassium transporter [Betaproteobacteria bacterium]|nr:potassium transporter [Betaproteobacteria bacterium]
MFVIGLEFNLPKLLNMRKEVFGLGTSQVLITILGAVLGNFVLMYVATLVGASWDITWQASLVLGAALTMSSTAIVVKMMADRAELESRHGRLVIGILLFQDIAVVPLLVLIPSLSDINDGNLLQMLAIALAKGIALVFLLLWGGHKVVGRWLKIVDRRKSEELFLLNVLLLVLGFSWVSEHAGLSLAMGAFLVGMLIAETDFKHRVEEDIKPFHDILLGLFFITIGMKLDWIVLGKNWHIVLLLAIVPVLVKGLLIAVIARVFGARGGVSIRTGIYLAQAGEFGFVLLTIGADRGLIQPAWVSPILAAMVLSMIATPFLIMRSEALVYRLSRSAWLERSVEITELSKHAMKEARHVIICGFGRCGKNLAALFEKERISFVALDINDDEVAKDRIAGYRVELGDSTDLACLVAAGLNRASAVVVSYNDTAAATKIIGLVKDHAGHVPVIVRTEDDRDYDTLLAAGAQSVVPDVFEGSLALAAQTLMKVGVVADRVDALIRDERRGYYDLRPQKSSEA